MEIIRKISHHPLATLLVIVYATSCYGRQNPPAQIQIPRRDVSSGQDVTIKCHIDFPHENESKSVRPSWIKQTNTDLEVISVGDEIKLNDPRYSVSTEHFDRSPHTDYTLQIRLVRRSDTGKYICDISRYGWHTEGELTVV